MLAVCSRGGKEIEWKVIEDVSLYNYVCLILSIFMCIFAHKYRNVFYGKKVYKNRIRVMLADKMVTKTSLAEQFGVSKMTII